MFGLDLNNWPCLSACRLVSNKNFAIKSSLHVPEYADERKRMSKAFAKAYPGLSDTTLQDPAQVRGRGSHVHNCLLGDFLPLWKLMSPMLVPCPSTSGCPPVCLNGTLPVTSPSSQRTAKHLC